MIIIIIIIKREGCAVACVGREREEREVKNFFDLYI
jgi:hypothetical protein